MLAAVVVLLPLALSAQVSAPHLVRATVTNAHTGLPMSKVRLWVADRAWNPITEPATPDAMGLCQFRVPAGEYMLVTKARGNPDTGIFFAAKEPLVEISVPVTPSFDLSGVVVDQYGDPLGNMTVALRRNGWRDGRIALQPVADTRTNDRGEYKLAEILAGHYVVCAFGSDDATRQAPVEGIIDIASPPPPRYYRQVCHPNRPSEKLPAYGGNARETVNFTLEAGPNLEVAGRVGLAPNSSVSLELTPAGVGYDNQRWQARASGREPLFRFKGVPPGHYMLTARGWVPAAQGLGGTHVARRLIRLDRNVDDVDLQLEPAANVPLAFTPDSEPFRPQLEMAAVVDVLDGVAAYASNGSYTDVVPGAKWLKTRTRGDVCVNRALLGEMDVLRKKFVIPPGARSQLLLQLSDQCGRLEGQVVEKGKPTLNAEVALLLSGTPDEPGDVLLEQVDEHGRFTITGLSPGRYFLWAWPGEVRGVTRGPDRLADVAGNATVITLAPGETAKPTFGLLEGRQ